MQCVIFHFVIYFQIKVFHTEEPLRDDYTLMDIAYIYTWRRVILITITVIVIQFIFSKASNNSSFFISH